MISQHRIRWIAGAAGMACLLAALAGCSLSGDDDPEPTAGSTPIGWATPRPATDAAAPTATAIVLPSLTAAPTLTPPPAQGPSATPPPTKLPLPTLTIAPTITNTPFTIITARPFATDANTPFVVVSPVAVSPFPSPTETRIFVQPPTFTPVFIPQTPVSPTPPPPSAVVCPTCSLLRLRDAPGDTGNVLGYLDANQPLTIIGRTADNAWAQVVLPDGGVGWVATEYLVLNIDLNVVSVTGAAPSAPTAVAVAPGGSSGGSAASVISGVSFTARQIFLDGLAKGNRAHAFTRVGDSISAAPQFLTQIGQGTYSLGEYGYLGAAISFFSGPNAVGANSFAAGSIAAHNSWGADSVLNPALAPAGVCRPGETPLVCEYRVAKPAVAIIMFGTNDSGGIPAETFRANLQTIVQTSIDMGVIPVLSTIPPKHYNPATDGRVIEFNQIIIALARGYDIPLIDYYTAMRGLPGDGLHPDGVHPSTPPDGVTTIFDAEHLQYGYTLRNLTALQMLYTLWQQVLYDADQAIPATAPPGATGPGTEPGGTVYECPGAPPIRLRVGMTARVTPGLPNKVREQPAIGAAEVGSIPGEGIFTVIGGPRCADGYTWWQVNYQGLIGWTASGTAEEYWLEPWE
mgnify:FL=1